MGRDLYRQLTRSRTSSTVGPRSYSQTVAVSLESLIMMNIYEKRPSFHANMKLIGPIVLSL